MTGQSLFYANGDRLWLADSVCHWPEKHAAWQEKIAATNPGGIWRCSWCERMLRKFEVIAQNDDGTVFEARDRLTGRRWKLHGTESWTEGAWKSTDEARIPFRY